LKGSTVTDTASPLTGFDPTDPDLIALRVPHDEFLAMRKNSPVFWVEQQGDALDGFVEHSGYWAVSKHADVAAVSKNSTDFSTAENTAFIRFEAGTRPDQVELQKVILINQDPPDHSKMRQVISRGFTPRVIGAMRDHLKDLAGKIVDEALASGKGNFVTDVASELPLQAIAELLGVPQEDRKKLFGWSNQMMSQGDPDVDTEAASIEILTYAMALADQRRADPQDDIVTKLITADIDGHHLTDDEFGFFVILLTVAGNETTRNAITWGMHAFLNNPDQWELYKRERPATAADEIIRWASPITVFQRTAANDVNVGGVDVKKGERVGLFYGSANYDEDVFEDPFTFNILRNPNPHQAFGGHGAHYCIGANLARLEVDLIFNEIADRMPDIRQAGEPQRFRHAWVNGVTEFPVEYK
jgi:cholest-4-en-3-one 26-monooxygenase